MAKGTRVGARAKVIGHKAERYGHVGTVLRFGLRRVTLRFDDGAVRTYDVHDLRLNVVKGAA